MRKSDARALVAENRVLKARVAVLEAAYVPVKQVAAVVKKAVAPVKPQVQKPKTADKPKVDKGAKAKPAAKAKDTKKSEAKEDEPETNIYAVAGVANPLAALTLEQIAEQYGSGGYDDLETPIEDHDRNWMTHPRNKGKYTDV